MTRQNSWFFVALPPILQHTKTKRDDLIMLSTQKMGCKLLLTLVVLLGNTWRTTAFAISQAPSNVPSRCCLSKLSASRRQYDDGSDTFTHERRDGYSNVPRHEPGGPLARLNEGTRREPTRRRQQQQQERYTGVSHAQVQPDQYYNGQTVQGGSRVTFPGTYNYPYTTNGERRQVSFHTEGRPLDTEFEVWEGPNYTPMKMRVYSEDGARRPFRTLVGGSSTASIRNTGPMAFPVSASVTGGGGGGTMSRQFSGGTTVQGGALKTFAFQDSSVSSVRISIQSQGLPIMAKVEVLQGPNSVRTVADIDSQDGQRHSFDGMVETPGPSTILVHNKGPLEFPIEVLLEPQYGPCDDYYDDDYNDGYSSAYNGGSSSLSRYGNPYSGYGSYY